MWRVKSDAGVVQMGVHGLVQGRVHGRVRLPRQFGCTRSPNQSVRLNPGVRDSNPSGPRIALRAFTRDRL